MTQAVLWSLVLLAVFLAAAFGDPGGWAGIFLASGLDKVRSVHTDLQAWANARSAEFWILLAIALIVYTGMREISAHLLKIREALYDLTARLPPPPRPYD
jgi:hypothetical protein